MSVKVGDKVRITHTDYRGAIGYQVGDVSEVVAITGNGNYLLGSCEYCFFDREFEVIHTPTTISTLCREKMEDHMGKGEYVLAVKWAQLAEQAEALENE